MLPIGYQLYSCRNEMARDPEAVFAELSAMGYDFVELAGMHGYAPEALRAALERHGLFALCAHVQLQELRDERIVRTYREIGCRYIALSILMPDFQPGSPGYSEALALLRSAAKACEAEGLRFLYHNHDLELRPCRGERALETILKDVPPPSMLLEPDCCWLHYSGVDPAAYMDALGQPCPIVHLKDYRCQCARDKNCLEIGAMLAQYGESDDRAFSFVPLGMGCVDIGACVEAAERNGASALVVEQDMSFGRTPLEAAKISIDYLRALPERSS